MATQREQDRADYEAWLDSQVARVESDPRFTQGIIRDRGFKSADAGRGKALTTREAFGGKTWTIVRHAVTTEFRDAVEAGEIQRMSFAEWEARARSARQADAAEAQRATADHALESLAYLRDLLARRGEMIAGLRAASVPWSVICEASGLSRSQADVIARQAVAAAEAAGVGCGGYGCERPACDDCTPF